MDTTKETKHTPGPLEWTRYGWTTRRIAPGTILLYHGADWPITDANACLIAAAPDLLAACERFVAAYDTAQSWPSSVDVDRARAAIAKARGA